MKWWEEELKWKNGDWAVGDVVPTFFPVFKLA